MPTLTWDSKPNPQPVKSNLILDSICFPHSKGYDTKLIKPPPENKLIFGDNFAIMSSLLANYEGKIDLIYADPPFFTNRRFSARIGRGEDSRKPEEWKLADGYPDSWQNIDEYLNMLYARLVLMHQLLSPNGTLYLHLDWHANAYARVLLDEIFGADRLINEIIWTYHGPSPIRTAFNRKHDTILMYSKSKEYTFNVDAVREPYHPSTIKTFASSKKAGFGKIPNLKRGKVPEDWWYFPVVARLHNERTGYPTQKPEALLERIILASSKPGDIVADFFCGSGTTAVVANRLGRRFIATDSNWRAVHTTRTRLVSDASSPFSIYYEQSSPLIYQKPEIQPDAKLGKDTFLFIPSKLEEIDYWEINPNIKDNAFYSVYQATRPPRKGELPTSLQIDRQFFLKNIKIRFVTINGEAFQTSISISP